MEKGLTLSIPARLNPTITFAVTGSSTSSPEGPFIREIGNVSSSISATITRQSPLVQITSWQWQYQENGGGYTSIGSPTVVTGTLPSVSTGSLTHLTANTVSTARYRLKVTDAYFDSITSSVTADSSLINYYNYIFYGPSSSAPTTSANVRALPNRQFTTFSNPFTLNTGSVYVNFTVALPSPLTISAVLDLTANAPLTSQYSLNAGLTGIANYAGITTSYKVYTMTPSIPYIENHEHRITRA